HLPGPGVFGFHAYDPSAGEEPMRRPFLEADPPELRCAEPRPHYPAGRSSQHEYRARRRALVFTGFEDKHGHAEELQLGFGHEREVARFKPEGLRIERTIEGGHAWYAVVSGGPDPDQNPDDKKLVPAVILASPHNIPCLAKPLVPSMTVLMPVLK